MDDNDGEMTLLDGVRLKMEGTSVDSVTDGTRLVIRPGTDVEGSVTGRVGVTVGVIEITGGVTEGAGLTGGATKPLQVSMTASVNVVSVPIE